MSSVSALRTEAPAFPTEGLTVQWNLYISYSAVATTSLKL